MKNNEAKTARCLTWRWSKRPTLSASLSKGFFNYNKYTTTSFIAWKCHGICKVHKRIGIVSMRCTQCNRLFQPIPLLYPISQKNYDEDPFIAENWSCIRHYLKRAYMFTILGYSAPISDKSAIELLKYAWGEVDGKALEEVEIIIGERGFKKYLG